MKICAIDNFMSKHPEFCEMSIGRCMYIRIGAEELFIIEKQEYKNKCKTFVFKYECGNLTECKTEENAFQKYFMLVPISDFTEFMQ